MEKPGFLKEFVNLAFCQFEVQYSGPSVCRACYDLFKSFAESPPCNFCKDNCNSDKLPVICSLLVESKRGIFDHYWFCDDALEKNYSCCMKAFQFGNVEGFSDLPLAPKGKLTSFGKRKQITLRKDMFLRKRNAVSKMLSFILNKELSNYAFICNGGSSTEMIILLREIVEYNLRVKVLRRNQRIIYLEIPNLGIYFLDSLNYYEGNINHLASKYAIDLTFIPQSWIKPAMFQYKGCPPEVNDLFHFEDSQSDIMKKQKYCQNLKFPYNFFQALKKASMEKTIVSATAAFSFFKSCFACQKTLLSFFRPMIPKNFLAYVHPFTSPIITKACFAFHLFRLYCSNLHQIKVVKPQIAMKSSTGEIQYVQYLQNKNPDIHFTYAWSPQGQTKIFLPDGIPDAYGDDGTFILYNGCAYHGHTSSKCPIMKDRTLTVYKKDKHEAYKKHCKKIARLKLKHGSKIRKIKQKWECSFNKQKQKKNVKAFLQSNKVYPKKRLEPRDVGKSSSID